MLFLGAAFAFFGFRVAGEFGSHYLGGNGPDPKLFIWSMSWWKHAILHGQNALLSSAIWAPSGYDLTWATTVPVASAVMAPVTALFGPVAAYNVLALLALPLAALGAYLLCYEVTERYWPSVAGGYIFGFSSYMLAHFRGGHLNLLLVFPIPLAATFVIRRLRGKISEGWFLAAIAATLTIEFLISTEVFATTTILGIGALALAYGLADAPGRDHLRGLARSLGKAYLITGLVVSPFLVAAFVGPLPVQRLDYAAGSSDLLNLVVPTSVTWFSGRQIGSLATLSESFLGSTSGQGAYVGLLLLLVIIHYSVTHWRTRTGRFLALFVVGAAVLSLGQSLHVGGRELLPLPWLIIRQLPLIGKALPSRFMMYAFLGVSVMIASWLSANRSRRLRWATVLIALALLAPAPRAWMWRTRPDTPAFFSEGTYREYLSPGEIVLILGPGTAGLPMIWQADTDMYFRMATAYTGGLPSELATISSIRTLSDQQCPAAGQVPSVRDFILDRGVDAVILYGQPAKPPCSGLGLGDPERVGGILLFRLSAL